MTEIVEPVKGRLAVIPCLTALTALLIDLLERKQSVDAPDRRRRTGRARRAGLAEILGERGFGSAFALAAATGCAGPY